MGGPIMEVFVLGFGMAMELTPQFGMPVIIHFFRNF